VAPTVSHPVDGFTDAWQDRFRHIAAALDRSEDAEAIIAEAEAKAASIAVEFPELDGAAITFARYNGAEVGTIDLVIDDSDFTRRFMNEELGFATPAPQVEAFDAGEGEAVGGALGVSLERVDLVGEGADAVVMFLAADGQEFIESAIWQAQDVVAEDRVVYVDLDGVFAVRTPSPAAIDYLFENVLPPLAAAARGDGASSVEVAGGDDVVSVGVAEGSTQISAFASFSPDFATAVGGPGPVTVFLPSDEALTSLDPSVLTALQTDFEMLDAVLQYHAAVGALTTADLAAEGEVETLLGESVDITVDGDAVVLNGGQATVVAADLEASNGLSHVIDGLLIPPSLADELGD
ncbi:MAG: fasciclin domain-containing protein, partial [Actinomycetota bacterium]